MAQFELGIPSRCSQQDPSNPPPRGAVAGPRTWALRSRTSSPNFRLLSRVVFSARMTCSLCLAGARHAAGWCAMVNESLFSHSKRDTGKMSEACYGKP